MLEAKERHRPECVTCCPESGAPRGFARNSLFERRDVLAVCLVLTRGDRESLGCSRPRQGGACVTSAGERLQVTMTMSTQGTLGGVELGEPSEGREGRSRLSQVPVEPRWCKRPRQRGGGTWKEAVSQFGMPTRTPQTRGLDTQTFTPHSSKAGSPRSRCWQVPCLGRALFLVHSGRLLAVSSWGGRSKQHSESIF